MRKLSPFKAVSHAFTSVFTYRAEALRIGMFWIPVLFALGLLRLAIGEPDPEAMHLDASAFVQLAATVVSFIAFSSMAVSWHRYILRDERAAPWRLDKLALRYAGNSMLIVVMAGVPLLGVALAASMMPMRQAPLFSIFVFLPAGLAAGTAITALSIKLPAVALGRNDFGFRDAWGVAKGHLWPILGVFLLNAAAVLGAMFVILLLASSLTSLDPIAGRIALLVIDPWDTLFISLFNASIFTSLYGFFVERRDF